LHLLAAGRSAHILPLVARLLKRATTLCPLGYYVLNGA
jgi:hypothetical protein